MLEDVKTPAWVRRAAAQEAERFAAFLGCTLNLAWKHWSPRKIALHRPQGLEPEKCASPCACRAK